MERNRLSACAKETNGNASNEGETETTNLHRTENALTKNNKTGDDVRSDQDLPLSTDGARNNTFNMSDNNLSNFGPDFLKMYLKGTDIDLDAFYGEMNGRTLVDLSLLKQCFSCKCSTICVRNIDVEQ